MERTDNYKYYVIQFLELPYEDIDEYVCVPSSWITSRRSTDRRVVVSYPVENPSDTVKRVIERQKLKKEWKSYMSVLKYPTDEYKYAEFFIKGKMDNVNYEYRDQELSAMVEKKTRSPKQNAKSNHEIDKPVDLLVSSKNYDKAVAKRQKRTALPNPDTEVALKRSKVVEPDESVSEAAEQPCQAFECSNENQPPPTREDFSIQNSSTSEIPVEKSDDRSYVKETEHVENSTQERSSDNYQNFLTADPAFFKELFTCLLNLHTDSANSYSLIGSLREALIDNFEAMKDVKKLVADIRSSNRDIPTVSPSSNTTVEVEKISLQNKSKKKQQDDDYDDDGEVPKKNLCHKRKVLPPEYDENDSRWTLKYRELAPGLVELMPHTNVYVNAVKLSNCKRLSKDCKSLARLLLVEIFTKSALSICSLCGSRARVSDIEGAVFRPGLDKNARTVLLTFVEEYGREKGWITLDTSSIQNSLRNKMQEMRFKYG